MKLIRAEKTYLCALVLLLAASGGWAPDLAAGGAKEDPIEEARALVVEKDYDKAIVLLAAVIREDPERRDEAEALLVQIRQFKSSYNVLFEDLISTITNEPDNYEKSLAIINQLNGLDKNPSPRSRERLENARITAKLQVDKSAKNRLLQEAREHLAREDYLAALDVYNRGFALQREDFLLGTQQADYKQAATDLVARVEQGIAQYRTEVGRLKPLLETFSASLAAGQLDTLDQDFTRISAIYLDTVRYPVQMEAARTRIGELRDQGDRDYPNYAYNWYVRFVQEFMTGPPDATGEGIANVARTQIDQVYRTTLEGLAGLYRQTRDDIKTAFAAGSYDRAQALYGSYLARGRLYVRALALRSGQDPGQTPVIASLQQVVGAGFAAEPNAVLHEMEAYQYLRRAMVLAGGLQVLQQTAKAADYARQLDFLDQARLIQTDWQAFVAATRTLEGLGSQVQAAGTAVFGPLVEQQAGLALAGARQSFLTLAKADYRSFADPHSTWQKRFDDAVAQLQGVAAKTGSTVKYHYPDLALQVFQTLEPELLAWRQASLDLDSRILAQRQELQDHSPVGQTLRDSRELRALIERELQATRTRTAEAKDKLQQAQQKRTQAEQILVQARSYLDSRRLDLDRADRAYKSAYDLFFEAYDIAFNQGQRNQSDQLLLGYKQEIENARQLLILDQMNQKIADAQDAFGRELYNQALDAIAEAEELFKRTTEYLINNKARNQDIVYLKGRIIAASTLSQERSLSEADPEFATISDYLQKAFVAYQNVRTKLGGSTRRPDAASLAVIETARSYLSSVLLLRPANWEAKLLQLRLEQLADPEEFQNRFRTRVQEATRKAREQGSVEVLTDLQALKEINPAWPGLADAITRLQIDLGIIENPVQVAQRRESQRLYQQALGLSRTRDNDQLNRALDLLAEAIRLNRENAEARSLSNDIRKRMGGIAAILSQEDQVAYNQAEALYAQQNFLKALDITTSLLAKPGNRLYDNLVKLDANIRKEAGLE